MNLNNTNILVTGAGGFIGSHLCSSLLEEGANVTAMLHYNSREDWSNLEFLSEQEKKQLKVVKGNVEDYQFIEKSTKGCDIIFHLAALIGIPYSYDAPNSYVSTNITGTVNVLEAARKNGCVVFHTSTSEVYGTAIYTPIDEKHPLQAQSPYSATKISADKIAESYFNSFDLPVTIIRPFNTYGPRQSARAVIPTIISQFLKNDTINLGDLSPVRDFTYVSDTVNGFIQAAKNIRQHGKAINLGTGDSYSIRETVNIIAKTLNSEKEIVEDYDRKRPKNSEVYELLSQNSLAKEMFNWAPEVPFSDGLKSTIDFVSNNLEYFKTSTYIK
ncbi:MAG: NAD-dependent dehydratase [Legionellales bacterium]|mgnify:CR=1 FL=1|nr:NAD-dependent dehydratase [Legionellales bacterium]OUX64668.1 MAG: NAD-dependent dehydratase [Gammaproteobacteria bacterium TMED281]